MRAVEVKYPKSDVAKSDVELAGNPWVGPLEPTSDITRPVRRISSDIYFRALFRTARMR